VYYTRPPLICSEGRDNAWLDPSGSGADKLRSRRLAETNSPLLGVNRT
jgi:hypothetical protein